MQKMGLFGGKLYLRQFIYRYKKIKNIEKLSEFSKKKQAKI
jgi:hypothetical protein